MGPAPSEPRGQGSRLSTAPHRALWEQPAGTEEGSQVVCLCVRVTLGHTDALPFPTCEVAFPVPGPVSSSVSGLVGVFERTHVCDIQQAPGPY